MNSVGIPTPPPGDSEPSGGPDLARRVLGLETRLNTVLPTLSTKADLAELRGEMHAGFATLRGEMNTGFATLRGEMNTGLSTLRGEMVAHHEAMRAELERAVSTMIKWMIASILGAMFSMGGLLLGVAHFTRSMPVATAPAAAVGSMPSSAPSTRMAPSP